MGSMKTAQKVLLLYAEGSRDFHSLDLKGQSFKDKNLSGADFSYADIRGADFTNAILQGTNFTGVRAGIQPRHSLLLCTALCVVAILLGAVAGLVDTVAELEFHSSQLVALIPKWLTLGVLIGFAFVAVRNGLIASFTVFILAFLATALIAFASSAAVIAAGAIAIAITLASFVAVATTILVVITLIATLVFNQLIAILTVILFGIPFLMIAVPSAGESAIGLAIIVIVISANISWGALRGAQQHAPIVNFVLSLIAQLGTRFRSANLTHANFVRAELKGVDFSDAILAHVQWGVRKNTKKQISHDLILN